MRVVCALVIGIVAGVFLQRLFLVEAPATPTFSPTPPATQAPSDAGPKPGLLSADQSVADSAPGPIAFEAPPVDAEDILGVGHSLVLKTGAIVRGADLALADIIVDDLHGDTAYLRTPHGSTFAALPLGAVGVPKQTEEFAATYSDAPTSLPLESLELIQRGPRSVCFVRGADNQTYVVWYRSWGTYPQVLRRRVRFGARRVEAVEGGGVANVATAKEAKDIGISTGDLDTLVAKGLAVKANVSKPLARLAQNLRVVENESDKLAVDSGEGTLVIPKVFGGTLTLNPNTRVVLARGDNASAQGTVESFGVLILKGDLEGTYKLGAHAHLHVTGSVVGNVTLGAWSRIVIDGDLRGTVHSGFHSHIVVMGILTGTIETKRGGHTRIYRNRYMSVDEMSAMPKGSHWRLYVPGSDLPPGKHAAGGFREVHIGGDIWETLRR